VNPVRIQQQTLELLEFLLQARSFTFLAFDGVLQAELLLPQSRELFLEFGTVPIEA